MTNILRPHTRRLGVVLGMLVLAVLALTACSPVVPTSPAAPAAGATTDTVTATDATTDTTTAAAPSADAATAASAETTTTETATESAPPPTPAVIIDPNDVVTGDVNGVPVGFTSQGHPFRGDPKAPVTMIEYSDFQCPFCARYFVQTEPAINESYVRTGKLRVIFRDFPIEELHPNAPAAHLASLCVAEQGADKYWEMHNKLFQTQAEWSNATDPLPVLERLAGEVGVDAAAYTECMTTKADELNQRVADSIAEGQAAGIQGTPSFIFPDANGVQNLLVGAQPYEQFAFYIDTLASGQPLPTPTPEPTAAPAEIPFWATAEGWKPDPDRPGFNMAGDQYRGNLDAKVTVIEFSDFQCPYCRQHALETQPTLDEQFVDSGDILWVFKHFPLDIHPQAPAAGAAAECAADQGKFWEMSHALFENQEKWAIEDPTPEFDALAQELGLDVAAFDACMSGTDALARVNSDANEGAPFVQGTPTFIVLYNGQGQIIPGALPTDRFVSVLQQMVDEANK